MKDKQFSRVSWDSFALSGDKVLLWMAWARTCTLAAIQKSSSLVLVWSGLESTTLWRAKFFHYRMLTLYLLQPSVGVWTKLTLLIFSGLLPGVRK